MGFYSRIYADTGKNVLIGRNTPTYLLVPPSFQDVYGKAIYEPCYDGYGMYGAYDIYELVAQWNKEFIPEMLRLIENGEWECDITATDNEDLKAYYEGRETVNEERYIGILMACYDEDNERLPYPIKVTTKILEYDKVSPSKNDPKQGCR